MRRWLAVGLSRGQELARAADLPAFLAGLFPGAGDQVGRIARNMGNARRCGVHRQLDFAVLAGGLSDEQLDVIQEVMRSGTSKGVTATLWGV